MAVVCNGYTVFVGRLRIIGMSIAVFQALVEAATDFEVSVYRRIIQGRRCSTIAFARFRS